MHCNKISLGSFVLFFLKKQKVSLILAMLVSLAWSFDQILFPVLFGRVIDTLSSYTGDKLQAWVFIKGPILSCLALWIISETAYRVQGYTLAHVLPTLESNVRLHLFSSMWKHSYRYFSDNFSGSISQRINDFALAFSRLTQASITLFIPALASVIMCGITLYSVHPVFCLLMEIWIFAHFFVVLFMIKKASIYSSIHSKSRSNLVGHIVDSLSNYFLVKICSKQYREIDFISNYQKDEFLKHKTSLAKIEHFKGLLALLSFIVPGFVINFYAYKGWVDGWISVGDIVFIFNTTWNILMIVWVSSNEIPNIFVDVGIMRQGLSLVETPFDVQDIALAPPIQIKQGIIEFKNVTFSYDNSPSPLFQDFSIKIQAGEKVGLVGFSGSGKSSFINLILRLFDVHSGVISIDGIDICQVSQNSLRSFIAYVPQSPCLFHRSIFDNIAYNSQEASLDDVIKASKLAHAHDFIQYLPNTYQTLVGERGSKLSGGQRQRIDIARAFLSDQTKILIMDEATSALDSITEHLIQKSLENLMRHKTTLVVAHRLSTLLQMDRLLVFEKGRIVQDGTHATLLKEEGGYRTLWQAQINGFLPE